MSYILLICVFLYGIAMIFVMIGFKRIPIFLSEEISPYTTFSVIVPFRNETENIPKLLHSIQQLQYPSHLFEIIFVNDASTDKSVELLKAFITTSGFENYSIIDNERHSTSPKKDAITTAINSAKHDWILTTDADCILPNTWLNVFDQYIQKHHPVMLAGPVKFSENNSFLQQFQTLDGLSLQAVAMGSFGMKTPILCNGANLAYQKDAFLEVEGFKGNNHIASGDDIFLLEKMHQRFPIKVQFLKSAAAIISTQSQANWKDIIQQRIRWASKTTKQKSKISKILGILVFFTNLLMIVGLFWSVFQPQIILSYTIFLFLKIVLDLIVIQLSAIFFKIRLNPITYLANALLYPLITILVVTRSLGGNYYWKGRSFKKNA